MLVWVMGEEAACLVSSENRAMTCCGNAGASTFLGGGFVLVSSVRANEVIISRVRLKVYALGKKAGKTGGLGARQNVSMQYAVCRAGAIT